MPAINYLLQPTKLKITTYNLCNFLLDFSEDCNALFLDFPYDFQEIILMRASGETDIDGVWNWIQDLINLPRPHINAFRYLFEPLVEYLPSFGRRFPHARIFCYQDLYMFKIKMDFSEKFLILTYRAKASNKIDVKEWKNLLNDEIEVVKSYYNKEMKFILENLDPNGGNVIIFRNFTKKIRAELKNLNQKLKIVYLIKYWRAPLEYLSFLISLKREISDKLIEECIREHVNYIDCLLSSKNLDEAHLKWSESKFKFNIYDKNLGK